MADWSRRKTLSTIACGFALPLAGCNDTSERTEAEGRKPVTDYEVRRVRTSTSTTLWAIGEAPSDGEIRTQFRYLSGDDPLADVRFDTDVPAGAKLESFVTATDFTRESIYLFEDAVSACHELHVSRVYRESDGVDASVCRTRKPADVACSTGTNHAVGIAVRLPFAIEGPGFSQGLGRRSNCGRQPVIVDLEPTTPANESATTGETKIGNDIAPRGGER